MISVTFTSDIENITCNTHVYQWDMKRTLEIKGLTFDDTPAVHFANKMSKSAIVVEPTIANGVMIADIPNSLLCEPHHIIAYVYSLDDNQCKTVKSVFIPLEKRPKPDDFVFEGNEGIFTLAEINAKVDALIVSTNAHYDTYVQAKNVELNGFMNDKTTQINNFIASQNADREAYQKQLDDQFAEFQENVSSSHNHHNLYYTESEVDTKLAEKPNFKEVDDALSKAIKIGDIRTTIKDDLGDDYLLCNGSIIRRSDYPELCKYTALQFVKYFSGYTVESGEENDYKLDNCSRKYGAVYVDGKWVFAGNTNYYGRIVVTENPEDESSWQVNKLNYSYYLNDICYGGKGVWVVSRSQWNDYDACVMIATDPLGSWTTKSISAVAYGEVGKIASNGDGVFCAVASTTWAGAQNTIVYSTNNGTSWSSRVPVTSNVTLHWNDIAYGNGLWVMIGYKREYLSGTNYEAPIMAYATSPSGTWTMVTLEDYVINGGKPIILKDIIYADGKFVISGYRADNYTQSDRQYYFVTYTFDNNTVSSPKETTIYLGDYYSEHSSFTSLHNLIYCNNKWMALGGRTIAEATEPDGEWTFKTIKIGNSSSSYSMDDSVMTDGNNWICALGSYGYITSECRHLPTISMDDSYTYIRVKESV